MDYKTMGKEELFTWCKEHGELEWLLEMTQKTKVVPVYPTVPHVSKTGKNTKKQDKTQEPIGERTINYSFMDIKDAFFEKFLKDEKPAKKEKEPTLADIIKKELGRA